MSSFFSDSEKKSLSSQLKNVADTFERPLVVHLSPEKTIISSNILYNRFQANDFNNNENPQNTVVTYIISGRILYDKQQPNPYMMPYLRGGSNDGQLKMPDPEGKVRIKVNESGMNILRTSKLIEFDGNMFELEGVRRPHGLFDPDYYTFTLKRTT